jgi:acyl dehydratase
MALVARQLYFESVKVGDELPPLVKPPVDRIQIARFAGASQDYNPLYVDEHYARNSGFPSALAPGMLVMGFLGELVVEWLRGARLRRFSARFVKIVWPGDVITCRGRVVDRRFEEGGRYSADIEVWAENQRGELVVRGTVTAQLFYSAEDESRQRAGQPPLVVTQAEEEARLARLTRGVLPRRPEPGRPGAPPIRPPMPPGKAPPASLAKQPSKPAAKKPAQKPVAKKRPAKPAARKRPARPAVRKRPGGKAARKPKAARKAATRPARRSAPRRAARRPARGKRR